MMGHISIVKNVIKRGQCACTWTKSLISDHLPHGPLTPFSPTRTWNIVWPCKNKVKNKNNTKQTNKTKQNKNRKKIYLNIRELQKCKEGILFCFVFPTGLLFWTHCTKEKLKEQEERPNVQKRRKEYIRKGKIN